MESREYHRLRDHERNYWWHVARRRLLAAFLEWGVSPARDRRGLDIGCGTGENFTLLAPYGGFFGTEATGELYGEERVRPPRPVVLARGEALPFPDASLGICSFFDVLEHAEDEDDFLREIHRTLCPGGWIVLSVPAYMFLWSDHDVSLHHRRRYVRRTLTDSLARNGFDVVRATYVFASVLPMVAGFRILRRWKPAKEPTASYVRTPALLNRALIGMLSLEARWLAWSDLPFGTSLFALGRKAGP